mmetsp:Transcript_31369/g.38906  ORF Transcript_31369/g.38906 Transcript_31369/m.38906 type:complete len:89 (+) Transcript_31369:505-771(+)
MAVAVFGWLDLNESALKAENGTWYKPLWVRILAAVIGLTFAFTIGYSRLFLGVHSWNQLIFGWQLGAWLPLYIHFGFREPLYYWLEKL